VVALPVLVSLQAFRGDGQVVPALQPCAGGEGQAGPGMIQLPSAAASSPRLMRRRRLRAAIRRCGVDGKA
jgi:hypothetical protein